MIDSRRASLDASLAVFEHRLVGPGAPFELTFNTDGAPAYANGPRSLTDLYARAWRMGDKALLAQGEACWSYGDVFDRAMAVAGWLRSRGWTGRRIALALEDGCEWLVWFVAISAAGACCVLPPAGASDDRVIVCCEIAGCDGVVAPLGHCLDRGGLKNLFLEGVADIEAASGQLVAPEAEAIIAFTSGSSGAPKGVVHTHLSLTTGLRNMMLGAALASRMLPAPPTSSARPQSPSTLLLAPLNYIGGYSAFLLSVATGGRIVLPEAGEDEAVLAAIKTEAVQSVAGASPALLRRLLRQPGAREALQSLRRLQLHGSSLQRSLVDELIEVAPAAQLVTGYGTSETAGSIAVAAVAEVIDQPGGCGRLLPSVQLRVVDDEGGVLPPGAHGALQVRGEMLMSGYLDRSRTNSVITTDGWYRTGDIGCLKEGQWLEVIGRCEDRIAGLTGFVAPAEEAVRAACGVEDVAVASSIDGKALILYLQARTGDAIDKAGAIEVLKSTAGWAGRVDVRLVDNFPRTGSGKIDRLRLDA